MQTPNHPTPKMLPPCDPSTLNSNPQFKALHQQLTTAILNPDGSTRALDAQPSRTDVQVDLKKYQIRDTRTRILKRIIGQMAFDSKSGLAAKSLHLVAIVFLYLHDPRVNADDALSLLSANLQAFHSNIPAFVPAISNILSSELAHLKSLANATPRDEKNKLSSSSRVDQTRSRNRLRPLSLKPSSNVSLSTQLSNRLHALRAIQLTELPSAQRQMAGTAAAALGAHAQVMERMIQVLERTKHGSLARAGKARAEHLAKVAEGIEAKVKIMKRETLAAIYTPQTVSALTRYRQHLSDTRMRLEERRKNALLELEAYAAADSNSNHGGSEDDTITDCAGRRNTPGTGADGAMVEIAKRYGALAKEVETVGMEIRRLGG